MLNQQVAPGTVLLEKYQVERVLGAGGMGVVVKATHLHLQESVAIKFLLPEVAANPDVVARFLREARAAARLKGEHVARVLDVGTLPEGTPYLVLEYLPGCDLAALLARASKLPVGEAVDHILQACEGLAEAHSLGVIHRDIKPANLFVTNRPDGTPLVKILDFGISKMQTTDDLTRTLTTMGTPNYMSPEQMRSSRDVDGRTDIWALGVVLYECVSGRRPFSSETFASLVLEVATSPTPALDVALPAGLDAVIYRCLEKDPAARFASIAELVSALAPFAGDLRAADLAIARTRATPRATGELVPIASRAPATSPTTIGSGSGEIAVPKHGKTRRTAIAALLIAGAAIAIGTSMRTSEQPTAVAVMLPPPVKPRPAPTPIGETPSLVDDARRGLGWVHDGLIAWFEAAARADIWTKKTVAQVPARKRQPPPVVTQPPVSQPTTNEDSLFEHRVQPLEPIQTRIKGKS